MSNFMGPMAPPQAAPQTPPQMDVKSSPSQRAQFKNFMRGMSMPQLLPNIGMGVPPEQTSFAPMPQNPMLDVDIFSAPPQMFYAGGPVGGGADAGQMAADAFSGKPDNQQDGPSGGVSDPSGPVPGPGGMADALSDILNAAPVPAPAPAPNYNLPQQDIMDSLNVPAPVQDVVNMATQGISVPGPLGIGSVNIAPDLSGLLSGDIGLGATYAVNFYKGGEVDGRERGIAAGAMGGAGPAADPDNIGAGAGANSGAGADKNDGGEYTADQQKAIDMVNESIAKAIGPDPFDRPFGFEAPPSQIPDDDSGDNLNDPNIFGEEGGVDVVQDAFGGDAKAAEAFIDKVMRVPTTLQKTPSLLGYGLGHTILSPESFTDAISDFVEKGGQYNPETGNLERPQGKGKMSMNAFGLTTYSGPTSDDPFANVGISSEPEDRILEPLAADEVDPCPPGYELKDGTCVPVAPNQIGNVVTPPTTTPPPPAPSVLVPSTRPPVGPLQGPVSYRQPVGYNQSAILTPEYFQSLLRPIGMQAGGEVLDKAAGQFLEAIRAA